MVNDYLAIEVIKQNHYQADFVVKPKPITLLTDARLSTNAAHTSENGNYTNPIAITCNWN